MSDEIKRYNAQCDLVNKQAEMMKSALVKPLVDDVTGNWIPEEKHSMIAERQKSAVKGTIYEGIPRGGAMILADHANALRSHIKIHGMPDDYFLASQAVAIQNAIEYANDNYRQAGGGIFEAAADMSTTDGVIKVNRQIALIMPVNLTAITTAMTTYIPGHVNQAEIFRIDRIAATTFGDYTKNDIFEPRTFSGQYTEMDQRYASADGDGTEVGGAASNTANYFRITANTLFGKNMPFKKKRCVIYVDGVLAARDDGAGYLTGNFVNRTGTTVTVTGSVDYDDGVINPIFSVAPEGAGTLPATKISIGFDINIEADPTLIPEISHNMYSKVVFPHESAVRSKTTIQSFWDLRREFNLDHRSMLMSSMVNIMAASKDRRILNDLRYFSSFQTPYKFYRMGYDAFPRNQYYISALVEKLMAINNQLMKKTGISGLKGIVAPSSAASIFMSMGVPNFEYAPGYVGKADPHYAGKLFGQYDLYVDPLAENVDPWRCLCFARGTDPGRSAYNVGTAISPIMLRHPVNQDIQYSQTLWGLDYRDQNPFPDAKEYLVDMLFTTDEADHGSNSSNP